jgi:hypothetical protein
MSKRVTLTLILDDETYADLEARTNEHVAADVANGRPDPTVHGWMACVVSAWLEQHATDRRAREDRIAELTAAPESHERPAAAD